MKRSVRQFVAIVAVATSLLGVAKVWAQITGFTGPMSVRFVGTLQPFAEKKESDLNTLTLFVDSQKLMFNVAEVYTQTGKDPVGLLLSHIWPQELTLTAPARRLEPLKNSANLGKRVTLEGFLFIGDNMLSVMAVKVG